MKAYARIADGFKGQEFFLLPRSVIEKLAAYPLAARLHFSGAGYFPEARHHFIERPNGYPDHILVYVVEGCGWYTINGVEHALKKDSLALIPPNVPHGYGTDNKHPWTIYWITFGGESSTEYASYLPANELQTPVAASIRPRVVSLFLELFQILHHGHSARNLIHASKVLEHMLALLFLGNEALVTGPGVPRSRDIARSIQYMRMNLQNNPTVNELAAQTNMSAVQFWRLFKKQTGYAPIEYFIRLKIQLACQYLSTTDRPLKSIADNLGYEDYYYFSRVFRKIMGISPALYRQNPASLCC